MKARHGNLVLIGFMGVGKGAAARKIAAMEPSLYPLDTDDMIESLANTKIRKIFATAGEEAFRALERKTAEWLAENVTNAVISTGGGFYQVPQLNRIGSVIYLKADFEWIYQRMLKAPNAEKKLKKRPLFQDPKAAKKLLESRESGYEKAADLVIDVTRHGLDEIARIVLDSFSR